MSEQHEIQAEVQNGTEQETQAFQQAPPKEGMSGCAMAAIGCGVIALLMLIIGGVGVYWAAQNIRGLAADAVTPALQEAVSGMEIPEDQKKQISARIGEIGTDFKEQKLTLNDLEKLIKGIVESPIAGAAASIWFTNQYINKSGLSEDEKTEAVTTTKRFAYGLLDKTITEQQANEVMNLVTEEKANGQTTYKETLTDKELTEILTKMKDAADGANVPAEVPEINFANEFDKVIEKTLGRTVTN